MSETMEAQAWSFHSVKGGVGKSTLAVLCAAALAEEHDVVLIDADLTGTSLADVLPLLAPAWLQGHLDLPREPDVHTDPTAGIEARARLEGPEPVGVPYLNDWLRHPRDAEWQDPDYDVDAFLWKPKDERLPARLRVIPSSALPADLWAVLPLLYDEAFSAFAESRLEWLLDGLLARGYRRFVFDTPPTVPGFSRAVLSMALRLPEGRPLATSGSAPTLLEGARWSWRPWLVTTQDRQDLFATERWLAAIHPDERVRIGVTLNRFSGAAESVASVITRALRGRDAEQAELAGNPPALLSPPPVVIDFDRDFGLFDAWAEFRALRPAPDRLAALLGTSVSTAEASKA